jgi:hypothetical protein
LVRALVHRARPRCQSRHRDATVTLRRAQSHTVVGELPPRDHELVPRTVPCLDALLEPLIERVDLCEDDRASARFSRSRSFGDAAERSPASIAATATVHRTANVPLGILTDVVLGSGRR